MATRPKSKQAISEIEVTLVPTKELAEILRAERDEIAGTLAPTISTSARLGP